MGNFIPGTFVIIEGNKKDGYEYLEMKILNNGEFNIKKLNAKEELEYRDFFHEKYKIKSGEEKEQKVSYRLIKNEKGQINVIKQTKINVLPSNKLFNVMLNKEIKIPKEMLFGILDEIQDKKYIDKIARLKSELSNLEFYDSKILVSILKNERIPQNLLKSILGDSYEFYQEFYSLKDIKALLEEYGDELTSQIKEKISYGNLKNKLNIALENKIPGFSLLGSYRNSAQRDDFYTALIDYSFTQIQNDEMRYSAGIMGFGNGVQDNGKFENANRVIIIKAPKLENIENTIFFNDYRKYLYVPFIKSSGLSAFVFPFKYLKEYANLLK